MAKMIIAKGLPASGKSTEAQNKIIGAGGNMVRINKDLLRTMLHFDKFTHKNEDLTRLAARTLAETFLSKGVSVIIDDTNLNPNTLQSWKDMAKAQNASIEYLDMTEVEPIECIKRDWFREKKVGPVVIMRMALQHLKWMKGTEVIVCDLDGTLCDTTHRLHYVKGETKDWKSFFEGMSEDPIRMDVVEKLKECLAENEDRRIVFVSARPDNYENATITWLGNNLHGTGIETKHVALLMRDSNDKRPDTEVKKDILDKYLSHLKIVKIFDDRPSVIRMWNENGFEVEDVGKGEEF